MAEVDDWITPQAAPPAAAADDWFTPGADTAPPAEQPTSWTDQAIKGAKGLVRGAAGFAGDMGQAVMGPFGPHHTASRLAYDLGLSKTEPPMDPEYGQQIAHKLGVEDEKPGYAGSIGESLGNPSTYFGPGGPLAKLIMGAASGAGGEAAAQAAEGSGNEGIARIGGSLLAGPLAARAIKPQLAPAQQMLADHGVTQMTPGQMVGGIGKNLEDKATSLPILGHFIQNARGRSVDSFNRSVGNQALAPIGEALERRTPVGHQMVDEVATKLGDAYDRLVPHLQFIPDHQFAFDMLGIRQRNLGLLPPAQSEQFDRILSQRFGRGGNMTGEKIKKIEEELGKIGANYGSAADPAQRDLGHALTDTVRALRSNLERVNPAHAAELARINQGWAMYSRIRDAASRRAGSEGVFMPSDLLAAVKRGDKSVGKGSFARGDALMQDFAEAGQRVLPSKVPDSGTAGRSLFSAATLGYLSPKTLAAVGASTLPYMTPSMALLNRYVRPTVGARASYANAGRGVGSLRPLLNTPFAMPPSPFDP